MSADRGIVSVLMVLSCLAVFAEQGFYREYYAGITGGSVADLTNSPAFPNSPTTEEVVGSLLETPSNIADAYGQRIRALLTPTVTGAYTFWIATDDGGELWLGTDATPATRRRIAYVNGWTGSRVWTSELNQKSALITLTAGTPYYIEALQKEGGGGDNLAVAWQVPGTIPTNVIPAAVLTPYLDAPAVKTQPASVEIEEQWVGQRQVSFAVEPVRKGGIAYQWQKDGADIAGATEPVYSLLADIANSNHLFRCVLTNLAGSVTSSAAAYRFVPDTVAPALVFWNVYHDRRTLNLTFSEPLRAASATNPAAYTVAGNAVLNVLLLEDGLTVVVRLADPLLAGIPQTLSLAVEDCATPVNTFTLTDYPFVPPERAPVPVPLARGGVEPPGPSSRRTAIAVSEINHTPAARADGRDLRFIEFYNSNPYFQDIGGYRLSGAFDYTFPSGTVMSANGYLVVAPVPSDIAAVYGINNVIGGFEAFAFDGTSEITLNDELGAWLTTVAYGDDPPWPVAADGSGHSLVLARPSYGEREADGWAASARLGGSPGEAEPARPTVYEAVMINEVLAHSGSTPGFVELHNISTSDVSVSGCVLKRDDLSSAGFVLPEGTVIAGHGLLAFDESALGFKINGTGDTLWLFAPESAGGTAIDAIRLDDQEIGTSCGRVPDGNAAWNRLETPTPSVCNAPRRIAEVVLSEIMYNPISENKDEEYVELHNPGTNEVDLTGWKLGGGIDYTFSQTLPAGGYLIVPHTRDTLALLYPSQTARMTADGFSGSLANSRDTVTLSKPVPVMDTADPLNPVAVTKNTVIESVTYHDGGEWGVLADGGGSSLERVDPRADPRLARSWAASDETQKSEWTSIEFTGKIDHGFTASANGTPNEIHIGLVDAGECLIDIAEVSMEGGANLVNNPSFESDTADWRFMGTHDRSSLEADLAAFDGARVLHVRASDRVHTGMNVIRGALSTALSTSGRGTVRVRARWLSGSPELVIRTRGNWLEASGSILTTRALGTPGQANSRVRSNGAPAIFDVIHQPVLPRNGEKITVYARVSDPDGLSQARLVYRVQGQSVTNLVPMTPCAAGYLAGEIPAGQPAGALVAFYVEAVDAHPQAACARFPANAPARECLVRYNEPLDSRAFGIYRFWMTQENLAYWATRERASNAPVDATFLYGNDRVLYHAAMMYAGSPFHSGYSTPINPGANIDYEAIFQNDDTVLDDDGMVLSTLGNLGSDDIGVREQFCYSLVQSLGLPHVHRRYIHLYANGAEQNPKKIFEDTEKPNAGVIKHWFPEDDDNDLFKIDDWFEYTLDLSGFSIMTARLQKYLTDSPDGDGQTLKLGRYRWNWLKRGYANTRANDYTNLFDLVEALNTVDPATYTRRIQDTVNLEGFVGVIAMNQFCGNYDTYGFSRGKNMYLYDSAAGWQLLAWDLDVSFGANRPLTDPINPTLATFLTEDPTMRTFLKHPLVARVFWRAIENLLASSTDPALRAMTRAKYDALKTDMTVLNGSYDAYFVNVETRRANVAAQLAAANPSAFAVTVPAAALSESALNVVTLTGIAPFAATSLRVNGADTAITWVSPSNWTAQVVLNNGTNAFQVEAYTAQGVLVSGGSVTRSIAYVGAPLDKMEDFLGITEIMCTPATHTAAYIEIANRSASTIMNLTRVYLDGAVSFAFPNGTVLQPGEHVLVAADTNAFAAVYGTAVASRVMGPYTGTLPASGGTLRLRRPAIGFEPDDPVLDTVVYESADPWPDDVPVGTSLQLINPALDNNRVANWTAETTVGATVTASPVPWGQMWKYFITGYPGESWVATNFNDAAWSSGPGPLGKDTAVLAIPLATTNALTNGRMAYYYRTSFTYAGNPVNAVLHLSYMIDDAAVFYLNGEEIHRSSLMPLGEITDATAATTAKMPEGQIEGPFILPASALRVGVNTLAVSVHQNQSASSDLVFGLRLDIATTLTSTCTPGAANALNTTLVSLPDVWLNEVQSRNVNGAFDNTGEREPWVELYNSQTSAVPLAGWSLARATDDPGWSFPAGSVLAARSFLRVWLDGESGESVEGDLHADLRFDNVSGMLLLRAPLDGREVAVDYLRLDNSPVDAVWGAFPDGTSNPRRWLNPATPAGPNRIDRPACRVVINEFMAQNDLFTNPLTGKKDDWFELFNDGAETVDLGGYVITDTLVSETPPLPDLRVSKSLVISNGVALVPGQALRIWTGASNSTTLPFDPANLQAPFGLGKSGDKICLFNPALERVDYVHYSSEQEGLVSMGRWLNGRAGDLVTFCQPTPGQPNRNPRHTVPQVLSQSALRTVREESPLCHTNTFLDARPAGFVFRLFAADAPALPDGMAFDTVSGVLTWTPSEAQGPGVYALRVCGFRGDGLSVAGCDETLLTLQVLETPSRPILGGGITNLTVNEGSLATFTVTATRAQEIPPYATSTRLRVTGALPTNALFNAGTGLFAWQTGEADGPCTNLMTVIAEDADDPTVFTATNIAVTVNEINSTFTYASPATFYLWREEPFAVHLRYNDPDLPPNRFTYSLLSGPPGLTLDGTTGLVKWQPTAGQTGSFTFRVRAFDNAASGSAALSTTVTLSVDTLNLQAGALASAVSGNGFDLLWKSKRDTLYTVEWCPDLANPVWQPVNAGSPVAGSGGTLKYTLNPVTFGSPTNAFFRILQTRE